MKIAHFGPTSLPFLYERGGAIQRRIRELALQQVARGDRVTVVSAEARDHDFTFQGIDIRGLGCGQRRGVARDLEFLYRASRSVRSGDFDVLHFHSLPEAPLLFRNTTPKLLSYDYFRFRRGRATPLYPLYRALLRRFDRLLPVSQFCSRESARYWKLDEARRQVLANGVNLRQFAPDPAARQAFRQRFEIGPEQFVLLYTGRLCRQKGTDLLIDAFARLRHDDPTLRLVVAGPAAQFGNTEAGELAERLQAAGGLYLGAVEEKELAGVYNLCDLFVMPTRADEMFGMAAAEAQACGKPVVCARQGGLPEVIQPPSGEYFATGEAGDLMRAIQTMRARIGSGDRLAELARGNAARFSWEQVSADLDTIYRRALPRPAAGAARRESSYPTTVS